MARTRTPTPTETWMRVIDPTKIRRRRLDKGFTQSQLAALAGCSQQYISMLESGVDHDCSDRIARQVARWLDVNREDLFEAREIQRTP